MAGGLDQFISQVQTITKSKGASSQLADLIRRSFGPKGILLNNATHLDEALQTLDLQMHSAAIAAILCTKMLTVASNNVNQLAVLRAQIAEFVSSCDKLQIQLIPEIYCKIFHKLTELLLQKNEAHTGILVLSKAIQQLQGSPTQLTSLHSDLCCLCLKARNLRPALVFLDTDIDDILKENKETPFMDCKSVLSYYYYGGMIYTALHQFDRALFFFEMVLTTPANATSAIMVEAYKKHLLVSLIHHGKVLSLPSYRSNVVQRNVRPVCSAYNDLAEAINAASHANKVEVARYQMDTHKDVLNRDNNMGLMKQLIEAIIRSKIRRLTNTFLTLSLADVAHRCQLSDAKDAEQYLVTMIGSNQISATIDQQNGMVSFSDCAAVPITEQQVARAMEECLLLEAKLRQLDTRTLLNPAFVSRATKQSVNTGPGAMMFSNDDEGVSFGGATSSSDMFGGM